MGKETNISLYRLVAIKGHEQYIPKYGIQFDIKYFDLDSLVRMYGKKEVIKWLNTYRS